MRAATRDLLIIRNAIAAILRIPSRKTADHRSDVHALAKLFFGPAEGFGEPAEETLAGCPGERSALIDFVRTGRLPDEHDLRARHRADDRRAEDVRTGATGLKCFDVSSEFFRLACYHGCAMKRFSIVPLFLGLALPAFGWTRTSDLRIAQKAAQLAPPDLQLVLQHLESDYRKGLEEAEADEGSSIHHYFVLSRTGKLRERIEGETQTIVRMIRTNKPMSSVVERMGLLAHLVADANNPFHVSNDDPRLSVSHDDFEQYFERRLARFPTVFYGLDENFRLSSYLDQTFARTSSFYPLMSDEYFRGGVQHTSEDFDDRSTAFGVASVCYSHAVTDLVNLYYYIWKQAGGDTRSEVVLRHGNLLLNAY